MDNDFLSQIVACPACETRPKLTKSENHYTCSNCLREYPIIDGIPHLVIKEGLTPSPTKTDKTSS